MPSSVRIGLKSLMAINMEQRH